MNTRITPYLIITLLVCGALFYVFKKEGTQKTESADSQIELITEEPRAVSAVHTADDSALSQTIASTRSAKNQSQVAKFCQSCQSIHPPKAHLILHHPTVKKRLSRDPKNLSHRRLEDGTEIVDLNKTFSHIAIAQAHADGSVSLHCSTSPDELATARSSDNSQKGTSK